jgi:putative transposase
MNHRDRLHRRRSGSTPGHAHELTFTCYRRYPFLSSERTCRWLSESIAEARRDLEFDLWAYVFMPDHVHIILRPRCDDYDVTSILKAIKAPVARRAIAFLVASAPQWLPKLTRNRGRRTERMFWQSGGGFDRDVIEPRTLAFMVAYLHDNPARRGLVERPSDWR